MQSAMVDHEFDELKREFLDEARTKIEEMESVLESNDGSGALERVGYLAHQLKGSGGSYGYAEISSNAAEIEKAVEGLDAETARADGIRDQLRGFVTGLRSIVDAAVAELR